MNTDNRPARTWRTEFSDAYNVSTLITSDPELVDISWKNDVCPSFATQTMTDRLNTHKDAEYRDIRLWVDHLDPNMREYYDEAPRYMVSDINNGQTLFTSDHDIVGAIRVLKEESRKALALLGGL